MSNLTVYVSIGNSDELPQAHWAAFGANVRGAIREAAETVHGEWVSLPWSSYKNACWCFEIPIDRVDLLKVTLANLAGLYGQDSIAWAPIEKTEFIGPGVA